MFTRPDALHPFKGGGLILLVWVSARDREDGLAARKRVTASLVAVIKFDAENLREAMADLGPGILRAHAEGCRGKAGQSLSDESSTRALRYKTCGCEAVASRCLTRGLIGNTPSSAKIALERRKQMLLRLDLAEMQVFETRWPITPLFTGASDRSRESTREKAQRLATLWR